MTRHYSIARTSVGSLVITGVVLAAAATVNGQGGAPFKAHPSTQEPSRLVTLDTLKTVGEGALQLGPLGQGRPARAAEPDHAGEDEGRRRRW